jgi:hypothetical protein
VITAQRKDSRREPRATAVDAERQRDDAYLPLRSLTTYSGLSLRTLRNYLVHRSRPLPHYRIGGKVLVRRLEFDAWAAQFRVANVSVSVDSMVGEVLAGISGLK